MLARRRTKRRAQGTTLLPYYPLISFPGLSYHKWCKPCKGKKKSIGSNKAATKASEERPGPESKEPQPMRSKRNVS
jgi:hypothetical protein